MKIRTDYVSNSSSSSFLVGLDTGGSGIKPTRKKLKKMLYEDDVKRFFAYSEEELCDAIHGTLTKCNIEDIWLFFSSIENLWEISKNAKPFMKELELILESAPCQPSVGECATYKKKMAKVMAKFEKLLNKYFPGQTFYYCEYGDEDGGIWGTLEHGNTFRNVTHFRLSYH